jgi:hypothetical protein
MGVEWSSYTTNHPPKEGLPMLVKTLLNSVEKYKGFVNECIKLVTVGGPEAAPRQDPAQ